jgi:predicted permease
MFAWLRRARARLRYRKFDDDLRRELEIHRELKEEELRAAGHAGDGAAARAARALGNVTLQREDARRVWIAPWVESAWQDVRYAIRSLRKSPGFALAAVLTLGIGIGFNASVFSMFNTLALRSWDVRDPGGIVLPFARPVGTRGFSNWLPYGEYVHLRRNTKTLSAMVASLGGSGRMYQSAGQDIERPNVYAQYRGVSTNFFEAFGIAVAHGRGFVEGEDTETSPARVAVITHDLWQTELGADPDVIGRTLYLGTRSVPVTVVGITRQGFSGVDPIETVSLFVPAPLVDHIDPDGDAPSWDPLKHLVAVAGRLKPGVSVPEAEAELDTLSRQFRATAGIEGNGLILTGTRPINQPGRTDRFLATFAGFGAAVLLVLLLACANVGNLQLARALARQRELAVRLSLGAGRGRVVRQLLTEAGCLVLAAAALGFGVAWFVPNLVMRFAGESGDDLIFFPDLTVVGFAMALGALTVVLVALAPALRSTRSGGLLALRARTDIDPGGRRLRSTLLAAQVALSLTLLVGASLLTRGIQQAHRLDFGFDAANVAVARIIVPRELYTRSSLTRITNELKARLEPNVGPTARVNVEPINTAQRVAHVRRPDEAKTWNRRTLERELSREGFALLGLTFAAGGPYTDNSSEKQAVINETLARMLWPGEGAVGRSVIADDESYTIAGVVRDTHYTSPASIDPVFHVAPGLSSTNVLFRTDRPDAAATVRAVVQAIDPKLQLRIQPLLANVEEAVRFRRTAADLAWAIGALGLSLATIGVFGVFAYAVEERRREIGIRVALGARARDIVRSMFAVHRWSVGGGLAAGLLLSVGAGFALRSYLFGLSPLDPAAYLAVSAILVAAAGLATLVPLRRATAVDPAATLRCE